MKEWLYAPKGYYATHNTIGKEGDFYTAVSSSMFFGGAIAKRAICSIEEFLGEDCSIIEIGAHKGYLLADIIQFIFTLKPELLETLKFYIVEPFAENQKAQLEYFKESFGEKIELLHVKSLDELTCKSAFIVANEIFDAFSCEIINKNKMLYVRNHEVFFDTIEDEVAQLAQCYGIQKGEVAVGYEKFSKSMYKAVEKFEFITFDYGDRFARNDFSLRIYEKHNVFPFFSLTSLVDEKHRVEKNLCEMFGNTDITYDVNFAHLIGAFEKSGIKLHEYTTQMKALIDFGLIELLDILKTNTSQKAYNAEMNRVKTLIDPAFMGERFKMCCFRKEKNETYS
jgi:SAM-dependent MidA family methyltransferase